MTQQSPTERLLDVLRVHQPDATAREAVLVSYLMSCLPYVPEGVVRVTEQERLRTLVDIWLQQTYDVQMTFTDVQVEG